MNLTDLLLADLEREVERSRRALGQVPEGKYDWKPHEKSMIFGYLAGMVATIPSWIAMTVTRDELDVAPADGSTMERPRNETSGALQEALDKVAADARAALEQTTEAHLLTSWRLLARGQVVWEGPRHEMIRDTISHWAHHRGQLTVYLRLMGAKVPALYGPSADDNSFQ
ncbi:MAG: DinB family protein [Pyrinomonadaceae bacterium]